MTPSVLSHHLSQTLRCFNTLWVVCVETLFILLHTDLRNTIISANLNSAVNSHNKSTIVKQFMCRQWATQPHHPAIFSLAFMWITLVFGFQVVIQVIVGMMDGNLVFHIIALSVCVCQCVIALGVCLCVCVHVCLSMRTRQRRMGLRDDCLSFNP